MLKDKKCVLCKTENFLKYKLQPLNLDIFECPVCGLAALSPLNINDNTYNENYYYFNNYKKSAVFDDICKGHRLARYLKKYFPNSRKIFDVGAAAGITLNELKNCGFEVSGLEISRAGVMLAGKLFDIKLIQSDIEKYSEKINCDVLIMTDVLEHTINPIDTLKKIYKLLDSGTGIIVETPNYGSFYRKLIGSHWVGFNKFHNYHFNYRVLTNILENTGFEVITKFTSNFNILSIEGLWRLGVKDLLKSLLKKNSVSKKNSIVIKKEEIELLTESELIFYKSLNALKALINMPLNYLSEKLMMGDQLWIIARKK
ncbi:MAG TPA: class I SAM-dependent methyltransferase [bacterium]|nr:class I SAM-dependent methyltransferase [bacterium]